VSTQQPEAVLVDTDVFSYLMNGGNYAKLYAPHVEGKLIALSFVTVGELYFGAKRRDWGKERIESLRDRLRSTTIVPYDYNLCETYGELKAKCEKIGKGISPNDLWIATCAVRHSLPLVSNNFKHFNGIPGLILRSESQAMQEIQSQMKIEIATSGVTDSTSSEQQRPSSQSSSAVAE
jgi:predicted nucleic acid-binding protein